MNNNQKGSKTQRKRPKYGEEKRSKYITLKKFKKLEITNSDIKLLRFKYFNDNKFNFTFYKGM